MILVDIFLYIVILSLTGLRYYQWQFWVFTLVLIILNAWSYYKGERDNDRIWINVLDKYETGKKD